jgi:hypothetical protein
MTMARKPVSPTVIEITVQDVAQLFDSLDPYPFRDKDLDKDAEAYIVSWARELPGDHALGIAIHLPEAQLKTHPASETAGAMQRFFAHRAEAVSGEIRELFRIGRMSLVIGVSVLVLCVVAAQYVEVVVGPTPLGRILQESLIILGWVANWRPLEIFLYEWWPLRRRRNLLRRLAAAHIVLKPLAA